MTHWSAPLAAGVLDLKELGMDQGAHLLVRQGLNQLAVGGELAVQGTAPELALHLRAWCRYHGHDLKLLEPSTARSAIAIITRGPADTQRWHGAERAGQSDALVPNAVYDRPPPRWGLAPRGAMVEAGAPEFSFPLSDKNMLWADEAGRLYLEGAAAQWDPETAVDWQASFNLADVVEDAVVQVMTFLVENETAALLVPARFLAQIHPHFREVMQLLAIQAADEARHLEVFTRRAQLKRSQLGLSTAGGQASLQTLVEEPDFALAMFLLSVLGEGTFLALLAFLHKYAPDPITATICKLAAQDEARHVAFGMAHLQRHATLDPTLCARLAAAIERRHAALQHTAGLNNEVFDALVILGAGELNPQAIARGHMRVMELQQQMDAGRRQRLIRLGFSSDDAMRLSALHTRNFM